MSSFFLSVQIEGQEMRDVLFSVSIEESDSRASLATLEFCDSDLILGDVLHEGLSVEIDLGGPDEHSVVFRGFLTGLHVEFPGKRGGRVVAQALDNLATLGLEAQTKRWWNTTVSQIVREIATRYAMRPGDVGLDSDDPVTEARPIQQVAETDLAFLHRLANERACRVFVDHPDGPDTLNFVSIKSLLEASPLDGILRFNDSVRDFSAGFEAFATDPSESLVTTDPDTGEPIVITEQLAAATDAAWIPDADRIARLGDAASGVLALVAKSAAKRARLQDFWRVPARMVGAASRQSSDHSGVLGDRARRLGQTARGRTSGATMLRPRRMATLEGFGGRWSGDWYLAQVSHHVDLRQRNYVSDFLATR